MSSSISAMPAIPQYITAVKDENKAVQNWEKTSPSSQQALSVFNSQAASIDSPQALLKNYKVLSVVLGAYGLSSSINQTAVLKDLMTQDYNDPESLAHTGNNAAWKAFAKDFSNWSDGSPLASADLRNVVSDKYLTNSYEDAVQTETPGLGDALYFTRTVAKGATLETLMADPKLLKVVETVAGFDPKQFGALDYDQQVALLKPRVDLTKFDMPSGVQRYAEQYLAMLQIHPQTSKAPASMLTLYGSNSSNNGIVSLFTGNVSDSSTGGSSLYSALF